MNERPSPPAFLRMLDKVNDALVWICMVIAGVALVAMTAIFAWLVFGRYVLNDTPTWVEQVSLLLVMVIAFFGAAVGVQQNTHLSVTIFRSIVPARVRLVFVVATDFVMAAYGALMFANGVELTIFKWSALIPLIQWPEGLRSLPLTICGALICLFSVGHLIRLFLGRDERVDSVD
ncbi:MAG: TRAP transporter small permease [Pseudomonadota bacterium]